MVSPNRRGGIPSPEHPGRVGQELPAHGRPSHPEDRTEIATAVRSARHPRYFFCDSIMPLAQACRTVLSLAFLTR